MALTGNGISPRFGLCARQREGTKGEHLRRDDSYCFPVETSKSASEMLQQVSILDSIIMYIYTRPFTLHITVISSRRVWRPDQLR